MSQPPDRKPDSPAEQVESQTALDSHRADGHWTALAGRMLDDVVRIVETETKLLEVNFSAALTAAFDRAVGQLLGALLILLGGGCILAALIMLLDTWLQMWQSLAISGAAAITGGFMVAWLSGRIAKREESKLTRS